MRHAITSGILLALAVVAVGGDTDEAARREGLKQAATVFRRLRDADQAKKTDEVTALLPEFVAAVQAVAPHLPTVTPEEGGKPRKKYHKLTLNADKAGVDGFRFQVPAGTGAWDLDWEFVLPKGAGGLTWNVAAREGGVDGFKAFTWKDNHAEKGADLPRENRRYLQRLPGGKLKAGAEYLIWFAFDDDRPVDAHVRVGLTPAGR